MPLKILQKEIMAMIDLPDFQLDKSKVPNIRLKSIHFENFKAFDDTCFDFFDASGIKPFACFFGPNGCGKTTILDSIQMIFSRFEGYELDRLKANLGKSVRHVNGKENGTYGNDDFLMTANIESSIGNYEVQINKSGFVKDKDHPQEIKMILYRLCFYSRFDQELRTFQLERDKWEIFKELFESVTGFEINESHSVFDQSDDPVQADMLRKYILGFNVHKPDEIIKHTECSAGEKKIIKSFSTLLNKEYNPQIILVDNVTMHVESGRHLDLISSMKKCFPKSQIFTTTHSHQLSKNFGKKSQLYDLRLIKSPCIIKEHQWRLYLSDEVKECISKLKAMNIGIKNVVEKEIKIGNELIQQCYVDNKNDGYLISEIEKFLQRTAHLFVYDVVKNYE